MAESMDLHASAIESQELSEPFIGPRSFRKTVEDRLRFFGRDSETDEIVSLITTHTLVLIYAQSGAGKTSIFNAQVIPTLEGYGFKVLPVARVHVTSSSTVTTSESEPVNPLKIKNIYIFNALQSLRQDIKSQPEDDDINSQSDANLSLFEFLDEHFRNHRDESGNLHSQVLIFDQLEELFTIYPDVEQQREFFEQVADSLENNPLLKIVFIIREDFLAQLDPFKGMLPEKLRPSFRLEPLRRDEAILAGTGPIMRIYEGHDRDEIIEIEHEVKELVEDLLKIYVELPGGGLRQIPGEFVEPIHLQVVCRRWWNSRVSSRRSGSKESRLEDLANVNKALEEFYEKTVLVASQISKVRVGKIRNWCQEKLITPSGTRSIVHRERKHTEGMDNRVVDVLKDENLVRREWRSGGQWYELTHDRLIKPIQESNQRWNRNRERRRLKVLIPATAILSISIVLILSYLFWSAPQDEKGSGFLLGQSPIAVSVNQATNLVYVANFRDNTVSVIDGTTNTIIGNATVGQSPSSVSVNPVTNMIYVANSNSSSISVIDGTKNKPIDTIRSQSPTAGQYPTGPKYIAVSVNPETDIVYVTTSSNTTLAYGVVGGAAQITVGQFPIAVSVNPNTNLIYVANFGDNTLSVINGTSNSIIRNITVGQSPIAVSVNPNTNLIYVANSDDNTLSVIDGTTNRLVSTIRTGQSPTGVSVNPNTNLIYVANFGDNTVSIVDGESGNVISTLFGSSNFVFRGIQVGQSPSAVSVNTGTNLIYVANSGDNTLSVVDGTTNNETNSIPVGQSPSAVAVNPFYNLIYVANSGDNTLSVVDGTTNNETNSIPVGRSPSAVAVNPLHNLIYVANLLDNTLSVIDGTNNSITTNIPVGQSPSSISFNPFTNLIYVANIDSVSVINGSTYRPITNISLGQSPSAVSINPFTNLIYVANSGNNTLSVINGTSNSVITSIPVGSSPSAVSINPFTKLIYVTNIGSSSLSVINGTFNSVITSIPVGSSPSAVSINPSTNLIYVTNFGSSTLSVINGTTNE